jgi:hypothetical protein
LIAADDLALDLKGGGCVNLVEVEEVLAYELPSGEFSR